MKTASAQLSSHRVDTGILQNSGTLSFTFNRKTYLGLPGDTLASALLANGQQLVGRSFKYHRPRGIFSAGSEEPNALVELGRGAFKEPNTRATMVELHDQLEANSQNHLGALSFDLLAFNDRLSGLLSAGFYYKTFMWPPSFWEKIYEPIIRRAAGLGRLSGQDDPSCYDKGFLHCQLLIVGAGPAGLHAALTAARAGLRLIIADEDFLPGGRLNFESLTINDKAGSIWASNIVTELCSLPNVRFMTRTCIYGCFDHGIFGAVEHKFIDAQHTNKPRQVLWRIYAQRTLLTTGATERSLVFGNNDRPGIMLAGAVRGYLNRFGVSPGKETIVFTNNDSGWRTASDLLNKGQRVNAIVDTRAIKPLLQLDGVRTFTGNEVVDTHGRLGIHSVTLRTGEILYADCLAVSGGWNPNLQLSCHQRGRPTWNPKIAAFVPPTDLPINLSLAGAANGELSLRESLEDSHNQVVQIIQEIGIKAPVHQPVSTTEELTGIQAHWYPTTLKARAWVDLQNDVTSKDIALSIQEGFRAVEHVKRYTTQGMATDQGRTSNLLALGVMSTINGESIENTGTTIFRPPYTPVSIGAIAGRSRGKHFRPVRNTPTHALAETLNAEFVESGLWYRAQWYQQNHEDHWRQSVDREVLQTRASVGICDVSTLGKIDIQGKDALPFIEKVYANNFASLKVGKVRYGLMLREDGFVMDDGTTARLDTHHFLMTTTTANAASVYRHLEFCRQCLWPDLDVHLCSVTEQWAQLAIAGPKSRSLLSEIIDSPFDISNEQFGFMSCCELTVCGGVPARLFRISFSGELAYEIAVPARYGHSLMQHLLAIGKPYNAVPYGTEALNVMRIEKGHVTGAELNGQTTPSHLGFSRMMSTSKDYIGKTLLQRPALQQEQSLELVGLIPVNPNESLSAGVHFVEPGMPFTLENDLGWMSSVAYSPHLKHHIGLGFLHKGSQRLEQTLIAADPLRGNATSVKVVSAHFIDPEGARLRD